MKWSTPLLPRSPSRFTHSPIVTCRYTRNKYVPNSPKCGKKSCLNSSWSSLVWVVPRKLDISGKQKGLFIVFYSELNELIIDNKYLFRNWPKRLAENNFTVESYDFEWLVYISNMIVYSATIPDHLPRLSDMISVSVSRWLLRKVGRCETKSFKSRFYTKFSSAQEPKGYQVTLRKWKIL